MQQKTVVMPRRQSQPTAPTRLQTASSAQVASNGQLKESAGSSIPDEFVVWRTQTNMPSARYAKRLSEATIDPPVVKEENEATARLNALKARGHSAGAKPETPATETTEGITAVASKSATTKQDDPRTAAQAGEDSAVPAKGKEKRQAVFLRLHEDRHRLSTKIEEQQR